MALNRSDARTKFTDATPKIAWFKPRRSNSTGNCVTVQLEADTTVSVRDSKDKRDTPTILTFTAEQWTEYVYGVKNLTLHHTAVHANGAATMCGPQHAIGDPVLDFTPTEWDAFVGGCKDGEYDF